MLDTFESRVTRLALPGTVSDGACCFMHVSVMIEDMAVVSEWMLNEPLACFVHSVKAMWDLSS